MCIIMCININKNIIRVLLLETKKKQIIIYFFILALEDFWKSFILVK